MTPPPRSSGDDEELDDLDLGDDEPKPSPPSRRARRRVEPGVRSGPVRGWDPDDEDVDDLDLPGDDRGDGKWPVYWRARDSLFFEPLVALAIVAVLLVSLFAYTGNWPPVYAIESNSMQHGSGDHVGFLNAGDIVLAQKVSLGSIVPYVIGVQTGFSTYGEPGDVLLYYPYGQTSQTPIIHRAIFFLQWNPSNSTFNATDLGGLLCSDSSSSVSYYISGTASNCNLVGLTGAEGIHLYHVGQSSVTLVVDLDSPGLGTHSGFLTLGDNNSGSYDQSVAVNGTGAKISSLVKPAWIIGIARGMIPWFGAIKLLFEGDAGLVPSQSWEFLGLTIAAVLFLALGVHYLLRREGVESRLRKREEAERRSAEPEEEEAGREAPRPSRFATAMRPWKPDNEPARAAPPPTPPRRRPTYDESRRSHFVSHRERPRPHARRPAPRDPDEDDEDL